jgi:hypothetical protein
MNTFSCALSMYDLGIGYRFWTPLTFDALGFVFGNGVCFGRHFAFGIECALEGTSHFWPLALGSGRFDWSA